MNVSSTGNPILLVEDNEDDVVLLKRAMQQSHIENPVAVVHSGTEAVDYLRGVGEYSNRAEFPLPCFIIVDIKMPRMTGLELLNWIRHDEVCRTIPTIIFTSSNRDEDIKTAYEQGANSYMVKPSDYPTLVKMVRTSHTYWGRTRRSAVDPLESGF